MLQRPLYNDHIDFSGARRDAPILSIKLHWFSLNVLVFTSLSTGLYINPIQGGGKNACGRLLR